MNTKSTTHLIVLLCLFGAWAYLWMSPTGNIKPGRLEKPLMLMLFGGIMTVYIFVVSKRMWFETRQPVLAVNMGLAGTFIGVHLYFIIIFSFNMAAE